ncbi:MAG TPA: hypothetical protein VF098_02515 [Sphingomicrobium sp.]
MSIAPVAAAAMLLPSLLGRSGAILVVVLALPWLAWRYDNETGAFLPLAVLLLLVLGVLALLLFLVTLVFFAPH